MGISTRLFGAVCALFLGQTVIVEAAPVSQPGDAALVIEHVTVLPMTVGAHALTDRTVVIQGGRIAAIARSGASPAAHGPGVRRINGAGKWLMPALTDMHVHLENERTERMLLGRPDIPDGAVEPADLFLPYVANGVLQVLNMSAMSEAVQARIDVESGRVLGPHMALAAMVDGSPPIWPVGVSHVAVSPQDGRQLVRDMKADGFDYIKTYSRLGLDTFTAIVDEARKQGMKALGHIPGREADATEKYFQPGYEMVAHAEEFAYQAKSPSEAMANIPRYVEIARHNGTWLTSTLTLDERIVQEMQDPTTLRTRPEIRFVHPLTYRVWTERSPYANASPQRIAMVQEVVEFNRKLVKAFADAGIPVLPGTDSLVPGLVGGFALHDELEALAKAGLPNEQILVADTRLAAKWLGVEADRGTVETGKRADLLLLDADPIADVANTRKISAVIAGGRYLSSAELSRRMNELAARYRKTAPPKPGPDGPRGAGGHWGFPDDEPH